MTGSISAQRLLRPLAFVACVGLAACALLVDTSGFVASQDAEGGSVEPDAPPLPDGGADQVVEASTDERPKRSCEGGGPGATTCGPFGSANCCESPLVSGGSFFQSYDGVSFTAKTHPADLTSFRLDRFEVTVGRFRAFVEARSAGWAPATGAGLHAHLNATRGLALRAAGAYEPGWISTWSQPEILADTKASWTARLTDSSTCSTPTWTDAPGTAETKPVSCLTWYEAYAFCIWDGGFLPSFAEWQYAAAGGKEQRVYPWSSPPDAGDASITCSNANYALEPPMGCEGGSLRVAPAGSRSPSGDGRWGHADLAGNLAEWTFDQFDAPLPDTCADCASFSGAAPADTVRAAHGGAFSSRREFVYAASAAAQKPSTRSGATGLRCARVP